jgi:hypothetical protein
MVAIPSSEHFRNVNTCFCRSPNFVGTKIVEILWNPSKYWILTLNAATSVAFHHPTEMPARVCLCLDYVHMNAVGEMAREKGELLVKTLADFMEVNEIKSNRHTKCLYYTWLLHWILSIVLKQYNYKIESTLISTCTWNIYRYGCLKMYKKSNVSCSAVWYQ